MKKIVFVSRLDSDCSLGAYLLLNIALKLAQKYDDLQIVIVGGGSEYIKIRKKADALNSNINRRFIFVVGKSHDPTKHFDRNTLFVGVSRAALEAMARSLPVILLGNEGCLGLLDESNVKSAKMTNFTCRGIKTHENMTELSDLLFNEICRYFELSESEKRKICEFSQKTVNEGYTAFDMATKTLRVYEKALSVKRKTIPKIAICGYYNHENFGDEAILSVIKSNIFCANADARVYFACSKNPFRTVRALWKSDLFIFGGGSLLQNSTSNASLFYYLSVIRAANLLSKRKWMLANGIGPFEFGAFSSEFLNNRLLGTLNTFDYLSVRDRVSKETLKRILPHRQVHLLPDPALIYYENINQKLMFNKENSCIVFIPHAKSLKKCKISAEKVANALVMVQNSYDVPIRIVVLNKKEDMLFAKTISSVLKEIQIDTPNTPDELARILLSSKIVISQRYHGSLFSTMCKIPTLSLSKDPKMSALCKGFSLFPCTDLSVFNTPKDLLIKTESARAHFSSQKEEIDRLVEEKSKLCKRSLAKLFINI